MNIKTLLMTNLLIAGLTTPVYAEVLNLPSLEDAMPQPEETVPQTDEVMPQTEEPMPQPANEDMSAPEQAVSTTLPGRGMTMEQVETRFGAPSEKIERVGVPPIARWNYGSFTVYFEDNIVLHAVTHRK